MDDTAVNQKCILDFFEKYGEKATIEAFQVSRRTLYAWRAILHCTSLLLLHVLPETFAKVGERDEVQGVRNTVGETYQ